MNRRWHFIASLVFAWILWEHVTNLTDRSEEWKTQGSYPSHQVCAGNVSRMIDDARDYYIRLRGASAAYIFNEGLGGFFVNDYEKHIFECYSSDFDPRPRK